MRRLWAVIKLLVLFIKELLLSSIAVLKHIIRPEVKYEPGIFVYKTELKRDWEVALLSCLICLTPGTLTLDVAGDGETLYIHAMDAADADETAAQIKNTFERAIREVSR